MSGLLQVIHSFPRRLKPQRAARPNGTAEAADRQSTRQLRRLVGAKLASVCSVALAVGVLATVAAQAQVPREAFTFTDYKLDVTVVPAEQTLAAKGTVTLRNDSREAQRRAVLQISSTLDWKAITAGGKAVQYVSQPYTSDIDHTGGLTEAIVNLPAAVAPGGTVDLQVEYGGTVPLDATRLTRIGTPDAVAKRNDWDRISTALTAVRGVGYVCWYPVAIPAVSLSSGNEVFEALGAWKQREAASTMELRLGARSASSAMRVIGTENQLITRAGSGSGFGGVSGDGHAEFSTGRDLRYQPLGNTVPAFAIGAFGNTRGPDSGAMVYYLPGHEAAARDYAAVGAEVAPLIREWFGAPKHSVTVVELGDPDAVGWESGPMLFTPLKTMERKELQVVMAHQAAHAAFDSPRPWIYEGAATFSQALEREQQDERAGAIAFMQAQLPLLIATEKQNAGAQPGAAAPHQDAGATQTSLINAGDDVLYRTKAMFCWWMLRDIVGDEALQHVLAKYRAAEDRDSAYVQRLAEAEAKKPLEWFFDDWVYRDRGLPDMKVESVYPRQTLGSAYGVTVTVENLGGAAAEVPVMVRAEGGERSARVLVPAHQKAVTRVLVPTPPTEAQVNDGSVPESDMRNNTMAITVGKK